MTDERKATLPRDLIDEIERELATARAAVAADRARILALEELQAVVLALAAAGGRAGTADELLRGAPTSAERERRRRLLACLR